MKYILVDLSIVNPLRCMGLRYAVIVKEIVSNVPVDKTIAAFVSQDDAEKFRDSKNDNN